MNERYMTIALDQAKKAYKRGDVPVGAIIVRNGKIIAKAYNNRENKKDVTAHAEIIAIKKACKRLKSWRLNDCTLYVTLEPCAMCMGAITQARISKVIYGTKNIKEANNQVLLEEDTTSKDKCSQILKAFFQNKRNS